MPKCQFANAPRAHCVPTNRQPRMPRTRPQSQTHPVYSGPCPRIIDLARSHRRIFGLTYAWVTPSVEKGPDNGYYVSLALKIFTKLSVSRLTAGDISPSGTPAREDFRPPPTLKRAWLGEGGLVPAVGEAHRRGSSGLTGLTIPNSGRIRYPGSGERAILGFGGLAHVL